MDYYEFSFRLEQPADYRKDLLIHTLGEAGFDTFEETETGFNAYIPAADFDRQKTDARISDLGSTFSFTCEKKLIAQQNWNALWESNFEPVRIGRDVLVRASFHPDEPGYTYRIVIDPKMAFGTGHHQTTSLMMQYLLETDMTGRSVLDMGAGTGILAILASMRGADYIVAIDNDENCIASIRENSMQNGHPNIETQTGSVEAIPDYRFDVIAANINRNILLSQMVAYASVLKTGGQLFLSGFYSGDDVNVLVAEAAAQGLAFVSEKTQDNWAAIKLIK